MSAGTQDNRIVIGSDHAAFEIKQRIKSFLALKGFKVTDVGPDSEDSCDYPDYAVKVAEAVSSGEFGRGLLMCGTGLGMCYTANKFAGVRAALCWSVEVAHLSRVHNDSNVLVLAGRAEVMDPLEDIVLEWVETPFSDDERHIRRIGKIAEAEAKNGLKRE